MFKYNSLARIVTFLILNGEHFQNYTAKRIIDVFGTLADLVICDGAPDGMSRRRAAYSSFPTCSTVLL